MRNSATVRKRLILAIAVLILAALACDPTQPVTDPPQPVCTPPACFEGEVLICPGECPGGCGVICVTPTPQPSTATPTEVPPVPSTYTPFPVCTPPACAEDEVFYCPGQCPGGCGTECATPTPGAQPPPAILSFTANRTSIVQGESIDVSWQATGAEDIFICWVGSNALMNCAPPPPDPNGGTATISPDRGPINLTVRNSAGEASAEIDIDVACAHEWVPALAGDPPTQNCPWEAEVGAAAQQSFQNGFMIWLESNSSIYVFYNSGTPESHPYQIFTDEFSEGDPESDPTIVPPAGLFQPIRGFGLVWRTHPEVRDGLGWATEPEAGFNSWLQGYTGMGLHNAYLFVEGIDGTIYHMLAMGSVWEVYQP